MYPPKSEQEFQSSPVSQSPSTHIATGYPLLPQGQHQHAQQQHRHQGPSTDWSTGLFGCREDLSNCCLTCCCPCITFGQIAEIVDEGSVSCGVSGGLYGLLLCFTGCACCYSCIYRTKMRTKFNLEERPCGDFLLHWCCEPCALCQEYRELKHKGYDPTLGWMGNLQVKQQGMGVPAGQTMSRP